MITLPVIILVGGPNVGKTRFYVECTNDYSTLNSNPSIRMWITHNFLIIDTPGSKDYRIPDEYSWQNVFQYADVILDFGDWHEDEVFGVKEHDPKYMTWSGDNRETMKRIEEYLQGR